MNLLLFNLATDADDPILGFTTRWINCLAAHYDHVDVLTMRAGRLALASNVRVYSVGKEKGYGEARRAVEFYLILLRLLCERSYAACFAHMMPLFAVMGAPFLRAIPITLWYTHRQAHRTLRLATAVSQRIVTAAPDSFPLPTPKLRVIGHGIDTDFFAPNVEGVKLAPANPVYIVHVARLMPIKHQPTLLHALPDVPEAHAVFIGDVPQQVDAGYRRNLEMLAHDLGVADRVTFTGGLPPEGVREWLWRAALAVNLSPAGLFDKAALESMAAAVPTLVASAAFDDILSGARLRIPAPDDHAALVQQLRAVLTLPVEERRQLGTMLRMRVVEQHSLDRLTARLVSVLNTGEPS